MYVCRKGRLDRRPYAPSDTVQVRLSEHFVDGASRRLFFDLGQLFVDRLVIGLGWVVVEHAQRDWEFRLFHIGQHHRKHLVLLVVDKHIVPDAVFADGDDADTEAVLGHGDALVFVGAEDQRLAVFTVIELSDTTFLSVQPSNAPSL